MSNGGFATAWAGILLMGGVMAINAGSLLIYGRRQSAAPTELTYANIGFDLLLMVWELESGRVAMAATWFALAVANYLFLRKRDPPEGRSLSSKLRLPGWVRG